jgi:hypothetical protein
MRNVLGVGGWGSIMFNPRNCAHRVVLRVCWCFKTLDQPVEFRVKFLNGLVDMRRHDNRRDDLKSWRAARERRLSIALLLFDRDAELPLDRRLDLQESTRSGIQNTSPRSRLTA